ncbi:MAG: hypothetical protein IJC38_04535 [Erysipelotrichaceae bacterium]|nr:hypothetical protein [Erysipelotrichaceae bacterium]
MKRYGVFSLCCFLMMIFLSGCTPSSIDVIENRLDGPVTALTVSMEQELKLMDDLSKLEYTETLPNQSYRFQYEWKGSTYEIYPNHTKTVIRKNRDKSIILTEAKEIDAIYAMLGMTPVASVTDERISLANNETTYQAVITNVETSLSYEVPESLTQFFKQQLTGINTRLVPLETDYFLKKQEQLEDGNHIKWNVSIYSLTGKIQLSVDLFERSRLVKWDNKLMLAKENLNDVVEEVLQAGKLWEYDESCYVEEGQEYSHTPIEVHAKKLENHEFEAYHPIYELTIINHSDKELELLEVFEWSGDDYNTYENTILGPIHLKPSETKKVLASTDWWGNHDLDNKEYMDYIYYDIETQEVFTIKKGLTFKEDLSHYQWDYYYYFANTHQCDSVTYYVDLEKEIYGVIEGYDLSRSEANPYSGRSGETIVDVFLKRGTKVINFIETEVKFTDEIIEEIQSYGDQFEMEVLIDFVHTVENYAETKNLYPNMKTVTLVKDDTDQLDVLVQECSLPMIVTEQDRRNALKQALPLSGLKVAEHERHGSVGGIYGKLSEEEKEILQKKVFKGDYFYGFLGDEPLGAEKPVIYLYSDEDMNVHVETVRDTTLAYPENPNGWDVQIKNDRMYVEGKEIRALYYEAIIPHIFELSEGFVVHKDEAISFLEEKLAYMGLTELEIYDFIVYWLPYIHENEYTMISFQNEAYAEYYPLEVSIDPDTELRIYMVMQGLDEPVDIKEQILPKGKERSGFTLVEWGGSIID